MQNMRGSLRVLTFSRFYANRLALVGVNDYIFQNIQKGHIARVPDSEIGLCLTCQSSVYRSDLRDLLCIPLAVEARQARPAGQELLHCSLFEISLLGDKPIQSIYQRIHIVKRGGNDTLLRGSRRDTDQSPFDESGIQIHL